MKKITEGIARKCLTRGDYFFVNHVHSIAMEDVTRNNGLLLDYICSVLSFQTINVY